MGIHVQRRSGRAAHVKHLSLLYLVDWGPLLPQRAKVRRFCRSILSPPKVWNWRIKIATALLPDFGIPLGWIISNPSFHLWLCIATPGILDINLGPWLNLLDILGLDVSFDTHVGDVCLLFVWLASGCHQIGVLYFILGGWNPFGGLKSLVSG